MTNQQQPRTEAAIEEQIIAKGLTAPRITPGEIDALMNKISHVYFQHGTSTFCHGFLDGRFYLASGHSACVSPENFDLAIGRDVAFKNMMAAARSKLWEFEGYSLYRRNMTEGGAA